MGAFIDFREGTVLPDFRLIKGAGREIGTRGEAFWEDMWAEAGRRTRTDKAGWPEDKEGGCIVGDRWVGIRRKNC